jgi:hypothetical protein
MYLTSEGASSRIRSASSSLSFQEIGCFFNLHTLHTLRKRWAWSFLQLSRTEFQAFYLICVLMHVRWAPCHHGMARPQAADCKNLVKRAVFTVRIKLKNVNKNQFLPLGLLKMSIKFACITTCGCKQAQMSQFSFIIRKYTEHYQCKLTCLEGRRVANDAIIMWSGVFIVGANNHYSFHKLLHRV